MAQCIHAAEGPEGYYAVALEANAKELSKLESQLLLSGVAHRAIREPDLDNTLTAVGILPCPRDLVRHFVKHLRLVK